MDINEALSRAEPDANTGAAGEFVIDSDLRTISIPAGFGSLGVESDDDVRRLKFRLPKMYGEFDLSEFDIRVNYTNAGGQTDIYLVDDKAVDGDSITFSWLAGRTATKYKGSTRFIVCLKKSGSDGVIQREFNTTVAALPVLEGLEGTEAVVQQNPDIIEELAKLRESIAGVVSLMSPTNHRNVYRGKQLGGSVTAAQKAAIQGGTFDDIYVGDYWVIGGVTYRVADMDYWYNCGDTAFTKHHLVIVPDTDSYGAKMNDSNTTSGGYIGSKMYTENLGQAKTASTSAFGDMVLTHREYLVSAVSNGIPSTNAWVDSNVELLSEIMLYGSHILAPMSNGVVIPNKQTIDKQQLALFALNPNMVNVRRHYWLRDIASSSGFACVDSRGFANQTYSTQSLGVRPVFAIG